MKRSRLTPKKILLAIMIAIVFYLGLYLVANIMVGLDVDKEEVLTVQQRWEILDCYREEGYDWLIYVKLKYLGENRATSVKASITTKDYEGQTWSGGWYLQDFRKGETQTFSVTHVGGRSYSYKIQISWSSGKSTDLCAEFVLVPR